MRAYITNRRFADVKAGAGCREYFCVVRNNKLHVLARGVHWFVCEIGNLKVTQESGQHSDANEVGSDSQMLDVRARARALLLRAFLRDAGVSLDQYVSRRQIEFQPKKSRPTN